MVLTAYCWPCCCQFASRPKLLGAHHAQRLDDPRVDLPGQPQALGTGSRPDAGRLAGGRVVAHGADASAGLAVAALPAGLLRLHLAGDEQADTPYGQRVIRRIADLSDRVVRHGPCDDAEVGRLYRSADLFVMPSRWETYGTAYAEALDAGLPVIGWRSGNLPHLVDDGKQGILITPGDRSALADALRRLAEDEPERRRMGAAAACRALSLPTWEQSAQQFFAILGRRP